MRRAFFSDLDNTLLFSSRSPHITLGPHAMQVETHTDGVGGGYMSLNTLRLLQSISAQAPFIPTTTRNEAQYRRISLHGVAHEYAVVSNGALILHNGEHDVAWTQHIRAELLPQSLALPEMQAHANALLDAGGVERREHVIEGMFLYQYVTNPSALTQALMTDLQELATEHNWKLSLQTKKLYLMPAKLTKGEAVVEVARRLGTGTIFAAGDALLDVSMLDVAARAWGMAGELDAVEPYPYERIPGSGFAATDELLTRVQRALHR